MNNTNKIVFGVWEGANARCCCWSCCWPHCPKRLRGSHRRAWENFWYQGRASNANQMGYYFHWWWEWHDARGWWSMAVSSSFSAITFTCNFKNWTLILNSFSFALQWILLYGEEDFHLFEGRCEEVEKQGFWLFIRGWGDFVEPRFTE